MSPRFIADKSALVRLRHPPVSAFLGPLILNGEVATCGVIELEVLYSARSYDDLVATQATRSRAFPLVSMVQADFDRAATVMQELAHRGLHRAVGLPDLLISAVAERAGLIVVHYDADYDFVATITVQPMHWVALRGSVP